MNWLDLLAVQGTLKSLLQHHSSKTSILQCSAFFIVQLSHPYMTTAFLQSQILLSFQAALDFKNDFSPSFRFSNSIQDAPQPPLW